MHSIPALLASLVPDFGAIVVNVLAVLGGAALGGFGSGWLTNLLTRSLTRRPLPPWPLKAVRLLGATAMGLAVYLLVFGSGGGFGLGGGWGLGGGGSGATGSPGGTGSTGTTRPAGTASIGAPLLRVEMLGGERYVKENCFYLLEGDVEGRTLDAVRQFLEERATQGTPVKELEIVIRQKGSVARQSQQVRQLEQMARDRGIIYKVSTPD